jgi:hypothetical protein
MFDAMKKWDFIAITLLYVDYEEMCMRLKRQLTEKKPLEWISKAGILNINSVLHNGQSDSGAVNRHIVIWPLTEGRTVFLSNLSEGCITTINALKLTNDFIRIRTSEMGRLYPFNEFEYKKDDKTRIVQAYLDSDKWVFYERGEIMPFENPEYYNRRKKKERLNFEIINKYLEANGWFLNVEGFWRSDKATYFTEQHPSKNDNW